MSKRAQHKEKFKPKESDLILLPQNDNQSRYLHYMNHHRQVIAIGCAGTGKTYMAAKHASHMYLTKSIHKIVISRPNVSAGKSLGYFPGELEEKMEPWMQPILTTLRESIGANKYENDLKNKNIEIVPFETMRGRSFDNSFIILDEAQNTTLHELKMFLTRVGKNCKVVICGDTNQSDIKDSGLAKIARMARKYDIDCKTIEFTVDDIVRSDITRDWIVAFEKEGA